MIVSVFQEMLLENENNLEAILIPVRIGSIADVPLLLACQMRRRLVCPLCTCRLATKASHVTEPTAWFVTIDKMHSRCIIRGDKFTL